MDQGMSVREQMAKQEDLVRAEAVRQWYVVELGKIALEAFRQANPAAIAEMDSSDRVALNGSFDLRLVGEAMARALGSRELAPQAPKSSHRR